MRVGDGWPGNCSILESVRKARHEYHCSVHVHAKGWLQYIVIRIAKVSSYSEVCNQREKGRVINLSITESRNTTNGTSAFGM